MPRWLMPAGIAGMLLVAAGVGFGLALAGGVIALPGVTVRVFPGLERWAGLALVPLAGAALMARALRDGDRRGYVRAMAVAAVAFVTLIAAFPPGAMDRYKAPRDLVRASGAGDATRDLRLASFEWFQPSVVFYARREVVRLTGPDKAAAFLATPSPGYLFVPESIWNVLQAAVPTPHRVAVRQYDFYTNNVVLVVTNEPDGERVAVGR